MLGIGFHVPKPLLIAGCLYRFFCRYDRIATTAREGSSLREKSCMKSARSSFA